MKNDDFDGKFILGLTFSDGTKIHYVLSTVYERYRYDVENWQLAIRHHLVPEIILSDDLISCITDVSYLSIGNFIEY